MAKVTIKIPGIGDVEAVNAASEETLLKILAAVEKANKQTRTGTTGQQGPAQNIQNTKALTQATNDQTAASKEAANAARMGTTSSKMAMISAMSGAKQFGVALGNTAKDIALSFTKFAAGLVASTDSMAKDPIGAAAGMVNSGLDVLKIGINGAADAAAGLSQAFAGLPIIGQMIAGGATAVAGMTKATADAAIEGVKLANSIFEREFKKTAEAMNILGKNGASFAGGMDDLSKVLADANLPLDMMARAASKSAADIRNMGYSQGEGFMVLAKGMGTLSKTIGKSGNSISNELIALGYSYEEQIGVMASYGAQLRASGLDLKKLAPADLARGTQEYAKNLKVISDITGQDAKKLTDKAREESMRGALMGKLGREQRDAFVAANSSLAALGPKFQQALTQQLAGGVITDPMIAGNKDAMELIKKVAASVSSGNKDIVAETQAAMATASENFKKTGETATDLAAAMGVTDSVVTGFAEIGNALRNYMPTAEEGKKSKDAADAQVNATGAVTHGYVIITEKMKDLDVAMSGLVQTHLPEYAKILTRTANEVHAAFMKAVKFINEGGVSKTVETTKSWIQTIADWKIGRYVGGVTGLAVGGAAGSLAGPAGTLAGGAAGMGAGYYLGKKFDEWLASMAGEKPKYATGGVSSGPKSGYDVELHGIEAVVPLPDGKSIPVSVNVESQQDNQPTTQLPNNIKAELDPQMLELLTQLVDLIRTDSRAQAELINLSRDQKQMLQQLINLSY